MATGRDHKSTGQRPLDEMATATKLRTLGLTPRECEVMRCIGEGKRDREIAAILHLSPRTVGNHAYNIFQKLHVETRTAAVRHCAIALSALWLSQ